MWIQLFQLLDSNLPDSNYPVSDWLEACNPQNCDNHNSCSIEMMNLEKKSHKHLDLRWIKKLNWPFVVNIECFVWYL